MSDDKKSTSTVLVELACSLFQFHVADTGETFGVPRVGPRVTAMLRGGKRSLRAQLAREYFVAEGRAATSQALSDALLVLEGMAQQAEEKKLHLRVARLAGATYLDLGDPTGRCVRISPTGWRVAEEPPDDVLFKRTALTDPLPQPQRGGDFSPLWTLANVEDNDRPLFLASLVATLYPDIPHPVIGLFGEQGTGKSTALRVGVQLIDPSPVPTRKPPKDGDSWVTAVAGSWLVGLDNLSEVTPWLSDSLCRAVTGDGDVRRRLYTDADIAVFAYRRCIFLSAIDVGAIRGDLADRMIPFTLRRIDDVDRADEEALWPMWNAAHPRVLGALLDLAVEVAKVLPTIRLATKPRMADFAAILAAVDKVNGTDGLGTYLNKQGAMATDTLDADEFIGAVRTAFRRRSFEGSSAELLKAVLPADPDWRRPKGWPANARSVTMHLHRLAPVMRKAKWTVSNDEGHNKTNAVRWTIAPPPSDFNGNGDSPDSPDSPGGAEASQASQASNESRPSTSVPGQLEGVR